MFNLKFITNRNKKIEYICMSEFQTLLFNALDVVEKFIKFFLLKHNTTLSDLF